MVRVDEAEPRDAVPESYEAADITVLRGLEPVRLRPGMYIGSTSAEWPAPPGLGGRRQLGRRGDAGMLHPDRRHSLGRRRLPGRRQRPGDPGRAAPRGTRRSRRPRSSSRSSTPAGSSAGSGYKVSGGLHGVGVSVVNALSTRLELQIDRGGNALRDRRSSTAASPLAPLEVTGPSPRNRTGTTVTFWPDADGVRGGRVPGPDDHRASADDGVSATGPRDPFPGRAAGPRAVGDLPLHRRHRRLRAAPQLLEGGAVPQGGLLRAGRRRPAGRDRPAVEHDATTRASTRSPTASRRSRAACTRRVSRRP